MSKSKIDVSAVAAKYESKSEEISKINILLSREKKSSAIEAFNIALKTAKSELKSLKKMLEESDFIPV